MSKQTEALKMALEALEQWDDPFYKRGRAITAIREALAEQPAQGCEFCSHPLYAGTKCKNCGREQPAQQRPQNCGTGYCSCIECLFEPVQQQEPVAYASDVEFDDETEIIPAEQKGKLGTAGLRIALYLGPPAQRKPLPAHEIVTMYDESPTSDSDMIAFARAIEAAHGIKGDA